MASGLFAKIGKALLIGGGTVLSLVNPAIGAPLITAGAAINVKKPGETSDLTSAYAQNAATSLNLVGAYQQTTAQAQKLGWLDSVKIWIMTNPLGGLLILLIGVFGIKYLFGKKR